MLFQHLFWFYSHPAVYIMILPAMGVISELVTCFSRKRIFGYEVIVAISSLAIAIIGFLVWGHHMFVSGQSTYAGLVFSLPQLPGGHPLRDQGLQLDGHPVQGLDLAATRRCCTRIGLHRPLHHRRPHRPLPGRLGLDVHVHDTYFIVAHFHYIMVGGAIMGYLGGLHFWWPKITGRLYPEMWARVAAVIVFVGLQPDLLPAVHPGLPGHAAALPRLPARSSRS